MLTVYSKVVNGQNKTVSKEKFGQIMVGTQSYGVTKATVFFIVHLGLNCVANKCAVHLRFYRNKKSSAMRKNQYCLRQFNC
jgi:hypothetical protein